MRKKIFSIWSVLLILVVSLAVLAPGCDGTTGTTIEVDATLDGLPWTGAVQYTLTGPGAAAPTIINGTSVSANHTVDAGNWTCAYVSGGPGFFVDITPSANQTVAEGGTIGFTLNFVTVPPLDASVEFISWTINGMPVDPGVVHFVFSGDWIDVEYKEHVDGEEGAVVTVHQTSWLLVHNQGYEGEPGPPIILHTVNAPGAVTMDPPAESKANQQATVEGVPVDECTEVPLEYCEPVWLDVEVDWELLICTNYTKTINWIGLPAAGEQILVNGAEVVFDIIPPLAPGQMLTLVADACVEMEGDTNQENDCAGDSPPLDIIYVGDPI